MTIASIVLDPAATSYTDNEVIEKINSATAGITRSNSVAAVARPIEGGEVGVTELFNGVAKENLDSMVDIERGYPKTDPQSGEYKIVSIQVDATEKLRTNYDDVPMP